MGTVSVTNTNVVYGTSAVSAGESSSGGPTETNPRIMLGQANQSPDDPPQNMGERNVSGGAGPIKRGESKVSAVSAVSADSGDSGRALVAHPEQAPREPQSWGEWGREIWSNVTASFNPAFVLQLKRGSHYGFGLPEQNDGGCIEGTQSPSGRFARSVNGTCPECPPCIEFPIIYPPDNQTLTIPPASTAAPSISPSIPPSIPPSSTSQAVSTEEDNADAAQQHEARETPLFSGWAASGVQLELEARGNLGSNGQRHATAQVSLMSESGASFAGIVGVSIAAQTGVQLCARTMTTESIFTATRRRGGFTVPFSNQLSSPFGPGEGGFNNAPQTGAGGAGAGIEFRQEYHWDVCNTRSERVRVGLIGTALVTAHVAGGALGGFAGAQVGMMDIGAATGGAMGSTIATQLMRMTRWTRPDREVASTEAILGSLQGNFRTEVPGGYFHVGGRVEARVRAESDIPQMQSFPSLPERGVVEMVNMEARDEEIGFGGDGDGSPLRHRSIQPTN